MCLGATPAKKTDRARIVSGALGNRSQEYRALKRK